MALLVGCSSSVETVAPPPCNGCSEAIQDHEKVYSACDSSVNKYSSLYACVCDGLHVAPYPCEDWCSTAEMSGACLSVVEKECGTQFLVCDQDK